MPNQNNNQQNKKTPAEIEKEKWEDGQKNRLVSNQNNNEELAEKMHIWYLEAVQELDPESYNRKAVRGYSELTEQQKFIDRYIAGKTIELISQAEQRGKREELLGDKKYQEMAIKHAAIKWELYQEVLLLKTMCKEMKRERDCAEKKLKDVLEWANNNAVATANNYMWCDGYNEAKGELRQILTGEK